MKNNSYIKRFLRYIDATPIHPILLFIIFASLGGIGVYLFQENNKFIDIFLSCLGSGLSAATVQCALIQNRIQKDSIKIQLFDKRYAVFQALLDSVTIIRRNNWDRYILFNGNDVSRQMIDIEENLYKSVQLSICLFDQELYAKLCAVNDAFCKVAKSFKNMLVTNINSLSSEEEVQSFLKQISSQIISQDGLNSKEYKDKLKDKFPKVYISLKEFTDECDAYVSFVEECGIKKEFGKYIVVDSLDK
ncbi:MAG: hypothetical protein ACI3YG_08270 [Prevotella sp.]